LSKDEKLELGLFLRNAGNNWSSTILLAISQEYYNLHFEQVDYTTATSDFDIKEPEL